jgi:hypothetical protein
MCDLTGGDKAGTILRLRRVSTLAAAGAETHQHTLTANFSFDFSGSTSGPSSYTFL